MSCRYAAPECFKRFRERKNDSPKVMAAGDIFAFSILLLECLTRKMPWKESKTESEASSGFSSQKKSESSQA
jgi:serine/threonine protein kinase